MSQNDYQRPRDKHEKIARRLARYSEACEMAAEGIAKPETVRVLDLFAEGYNGVEIAEITGWSRSYVYDLVKDPTGEKADERRHKRYGICKDCGAKTFNGGAVEVPERCLDCERNRYADRNALLVAMWEADIPTREIAETLGTSETNVGSWVDDQRNRFTPPLKLRRRRNRELWPEIERLWNAGWTVRSISDMLKASPENIAFMIRGMRRAGIDLPKRHPGRKVAA